MKTENDLPSVINDLSIHVLPGRVKSPIPGLQEAKDAEQLGFKRIWLPERYSNKEAGVTLSAMASVTKRIGVATGPLMLSARPPIVTAAMALTMNALYGPRFTLGVGRGDSDWAMAHGFNQLSYKELVECVSVIKRLWAGEIVSYKGANGESIELTIDDRPDIEMPKVAMFHFGGPVASKVAANAVFDEVGLTTMLKPQAVFNSIEITRKECERTGRNFDDIHFIAPVSSAPDVNEEDVRVLVASRIVLYLQSPALGDALVRLNEWDENIKNKIRNHSMFQNMRTRMADKSFERKDVVEVTKLVPEQWIHDAAVVGSADECVKTLQRFLDAGAHEIDLYSSSPQENESLVKAWRKHSKTSPGRKGI